MFKRKTFLLKKGIFPILLFVLGSSKNSFAFDPFTIATVISAGVSAVSSVTDSLGEAGESAQAFTELYSELSPDAEVSKEGQALIDQMNEVEKLAREAGYTEEQISSLLETDRNEVKKLSAVLRKTTRAVQLINRVSKLFPKLDKKAQVAQVASAQTEREILKSQYEIIAQARMAALQPKKEELKKKIEKKKYIESQESKIQKKGGFKWGRIGIYSFPNLNPAFHEALEIAGMLKKLLLVLVLPVFLLRRIRIGVVFGGEEQYSRLLRDTVLCAFWLFVMPQLIQLISEQTSAFAAQVAANHPLSPSLATGGGKIAEPPEVSSWQGIYEGLAWVFLNIKILVFWIVDFVFNLGLAILIVFFPLIIFSSTMLQSSMGIKRYLSMYIALALWPLYWNVIGLLAIKIWDHSELASLASLSSVFLTLVQFVAPFLGYKFMQGHGVMESLGGAASHVLNAPGKMMSLARGVAQKPGGNSSAHAVSAATQGLAQGVGRGGSYLATQGLQRGYSALSRAKGESQSSRSSPASIASQGVRGFVSNQAQGSSQYGSGKASNLRHASSRVWQGLKPAQRIRNPQNREIKI